MAEELITSTGTTVTHDETAGLQNSVVTPNVPGDANDDDVAVSTLPSAFSTRLTTLGFDPDDAIGAAESDGNVITINGTGISDLALTDANGDPLDGDSSGLFTTEGDEVFLFTDPVDNNIVLGKTEAGDIVFAIYLEETGTPVSGGKLWTVEYESLSHNDPTNPDDPDRVDLTNKLFVTADQAVVFNFDQLVSGANLFGVVGTTSTALVVIGEDITLDAAGKYIPNQTDDIKTSQGGDGATIGVDSQMFDPAEGAYFTYVTNTSVIGVGDNANSIQYGGTQEVTGAAFRISQTQGNDLATAEISAYDLDDAPQGVAFVNARGTGDPVSITAVRVFNAAGTLIEEETDGSAPSVNDPTVDIVFSDGPDGARIATVSGLDDLYTIAWDTSAVHDQVLIKGVAGKFDIGRFALTQAESDTDEVGSKVLFEDDGPVNNAATVNVNVDEDELTGLSTGITDNDATTTVASFTGAQIAGLVDAGADEPVKVSLNPAIDGADTGLDSKGSNILFDVVSATQVNGVADGRTVFTLVQTAGTDTILGTADDAFTFTLLDQVDHVPLATGGGDAETIALSLASVFVATDFDHAGTTGDSVVIDAGASVTIENDVPQNNAAVVNVDVDEDELTGLSTGITDNDATTTVASFTGAQIAGLVDAGADEPVKVSLNPAIDGADTGLDSKGSNILFDVVSATQVNGVADGRTVFTLVQTAGTDTILGTADDAFTFTLLDQVDHVPLATGGGDAETIALSLASVFLATDFDGDSVVIDAGASVTIENDVPTIGLISDGLVDFAAGSTVTNTLNGVVGADEPATFSITSSPANVTIFDGTSAELTLLRDISPDATVVTYFQDDGDGTHDAGDTDFFQLTLSGGNYTFDVLQDPPPATLDFNFDQLVSGASLFGVVGTTSNALVVIGEDITLDAAGKYIPNQTDDIKTSQGGEGATIGIDSQMFDPGEGAYFTYVTNTSVLGVGDNANSIDYGDTLEVTSASFRISQTQGNALATAEISAYDLDDAPQEVAFVNARGTGDPVSITTVSVFNAAGTLIEEETDGSAPSVNDPTVDIVFSDGPDGARIATVSGLDDLYEIQWDTGAVHDQVLIKGVAGKFDIGEFAISQPQPTPDEKLDFTAQIADFDGDTASASFSIGIDGTGVFDNNHVDGVNA